MHQHQKQQRIRLAGRRERTREVLGAHCSNTIQRLRIVEVIDNMVERNKGEFLPSRVRERQQPLDVAEQWDNEEWHALSFLHEYATLYGWYLEILSSRSTYGLSARGTLNRERMTLTKPLMRSGSSFNIMKSSIQLSKLNTKESGTLSLSLVCFSNTERLSKME